jgi:hypothetical protein
VAHRKVPLIKGWQNCATSNLEQLAAWSVEFPGCNWGMATGSPSGVVVIDIDGAMGRESQTALEQEDNMFPPTLVVETGRADGGVHLYYLQPHCVDLRSSASKIGSHIDVRATGSFVVYPPSIHASGRQYRFVDSDESLATLPAWIIDRLTPAKPAEPNPAKKSRLVPCFRDIGILTVGQRYDGLLRLAGALRRRGANQHELETELLQANARRCRPPKPIAKVLEIARDAMKWPVGGPDPLETAWSSVPESGGYEQLLALAHQLQVARPDLPIALPLERIGKLMGRDCAPSVKAASAT